jgi:hypothetical protein
LFLNWTFFGIEFPAICFFVVYYEFAKKRKKKNEKKLRKKYCKLKETPLGTQAASSGFSALTSLKKQ